MDIKDINIRVPAIDKLLDMTASGIGATAGAFLRPWIAGREAEAQRRLAEGQADSIRTMAQAHADARALMIPSDANIQGEIDFGTLVEQRILYQEAKRTENALTAVQQAAYELGDEEVLATEPDHDWTAQFFSGVQDVSSEEMRVLWAKVLAGEVRSPGSTSIKTLNILKVLDPRTAKLFQRLCSLSMSLGDLDSRVHALGGNAGQNALQEHGLSYDNLTTLEEYGLIVSDYNSGFDYQLSIKRRVGDIQVVFPFSFQGRNWLLEADGQRPSGVFSVSGVALTGSGRELSQVIALDVMDGFTQALKEYFNTQNLRMVEA